ncbi:MAG: tetratricopeptide repeat protein [Gammaproteobacteria bacterium]|nr:tetratricopeptide repeat protein [Gammaproteobacteria bacterium]MDH3370956.1 tetratricopeptide repeat protein [Gammaproteobacteria bacterium]MDH3405814.1 tetratricopeptide repeat protein [Gammaproteobacteria bacterium]MDH5487509.1 tetratricopeptide repeat protein [Gammaproteobacteria bacterium]
MNTRFFYLVIVVITTLLSACASLYAPTPEARPVSVNNAVLALVDAARKDNANGKPDAAVATLERALRIEPRNPVLWQELARLRLQQGQHQQAEGLAARSNGWAGEDKALRAENWRLIGEARLKRGDHAGAQAAFDTAARLVTE